MVKTDHQVAALAAASGHSLEDATIICIALDQIGWTLMPKGKIPDFGKLQTQSSLGMILECQAIAPGLSLHDLVSVFYEGKDQAKPGDSLAGNPSKWPDVRGVKAVVDAVLAAVYLKQ